MLNSGANNFSILQTELLCSERHLIETQLKSTIDIILKLMKVNEK